MKKALSVILAALMAAMSIPAFAFETENVEGTFEPETAAFEEAELEGVNDWLKPGLNAFNETTEPETFDDWTALSDSVVNTSGWVLGADPDGDPADLKIYMTKTSNAAGGGQVYPYSSIGAKMEPGRKYHIVFDAKMPSADATNCFWIMHAGASSNNVAKTVTGVCGDENANADFIYEAAPKAPGADVLNFQFNLYAQETKTVFNYYFDNFMIMPFYKITYLDMNGEVVATEQALLDEDGAVLAEYAVNPDITVEGGAGSDGKYYDFAGWSNVNGADEALDAIPLNNADITLYPVLKASEKVYFTADKVLAPATEGSSITITASEAIAEDDWTIDIGYADFDCEIAPDGKSVTFTAHGLSGEAKVEAPFSDGVTATFAVNFVGGSRWLPGLNTLTGTDKPFGFEFPEGDSLANYFTSSKWVAEANPLKDSVNASDSAVRAGQQFDYIHTWASYDPFMEPDRKIVFTYDQLSNVGGYLMNSQGGLQFANLDGSIGKWSHFKYVVHGNPYTINTSANPRTKSTEWIGIGGASGTFGSWAQVELDPAKKYFYADNFSFIPYYKITYYGLDGTTVLATDYVLPEDGIYNVRNDVIPDGANGFAYAGDTERQSTIYLCYSDIDLYAIFDTSIVFSVNGENVPVVLDGDEYVIPTPDELGITAENFLLWSTDDGSHYYPGETIDADSYGDYVGVTFTAYCEDVTTPAMGFSYEGDKSGSTGKFKYAENIELDGRSLYHLHQYASTWDGGASVWKFDARAHFFGTFDANVYNIFQYGFMLDNAYATTPGKSNTPLAELNLDTDLAPALSADCIIYFYTGAGGGDYYNGGEHRVGNKVWNFAINGEYQQIEVDMSNPANAPASIPWNMTGKVYGFAIDPLRANFSGDTYIDYIRVYKKGVLNVYYIVDDDVAFTDENRGAGTGYMLSGKIPTKEGYVFKGWSLDPDGEIVSSIDLTGDTYVYAVFKEIEGETAPVALDSFGIRYDGTAEGAVNGLRFKASATGAQREDLEEYGFIVSTEKKIDDPDSLTFNSKNNAGKALYVSGVAFNKAESIDVKYDVDGEDTLFTAICMNIPESDYQTLIYARTYSKYLSNGKSVTLYGNTVGNSMLKTALAIKGEGGEAYTANQAYIDAIIAACEG